MKTALTVAVAKRAQQTCSDSSKKAWLISGKSAAQQLLKNILGQIWEWFHDFFH